MLPSHHLSHDRAEASVEACYGACVALVLRRSQTMLVIAILAY